MPHKPVDLASHINHDFHVGHPADFPVDLSPVFCSPEGTMQEVPRRLAVVRKDTGRVIGLVSDRYKLVPHQRILDVMDSALASFDVGPTPRGIYVDRGGARMRALFKFPALAQDVGRNDEICPCLRVQNTYDGTSRISLHIGAFRFVCTNLAVGGGGVFAGGFMSVHAGEIALEQVGSRLTTYLTSFSSVVELYRYWTDLPVTTESLNATSRGLPIRTAMAIDARLAGARTVFEAYNAFTDVATHQLRSARAAFDLLDRINLEFQTRWPLMPRSRID